MTANTITMELPQSLYARLQALAKDEHTDIVGLLNCISFVIIQERGLTQALTTDHHFAQVGVTNLLPEPD